MMIYQSKNGVDILATNTPRGAPTFDMLDSMKSLMTRTLNMYLCVCVCEREVAEVKVLSL